MEQFRVLLIINDRIIHDHHCFDEIVWACSAASSDCKASAKSYHKEFLSWITFLKKYTENYTQINNVYIFIKMKDCKKWPLIQMLSVRRHVHTIVYMHIGNHNKGLSKGKRFHGAILHKRYIAYILIYIL